MKVQFDELEKGRRMENSYIEDDRLMRTCPVHPYDNIKKLETVITKEEFLMCYEAWVKNDEQKRGTEDIIREMKRLKTKLSEWKEKVSDDPYANDHYIVGAVGAYDDVIDYLEDNYQGV